MKLPEKVTKVKREPYLRPTADTKSTVPDADMPQLPDGSYYEEVRDNPEMAKVCKSTLDGFGQSYQFGPQHCLALRIILQILVRFSELMKSSEPKDLTEASKLADQLMKHQDKIGVLQKTGSGFDPFTLWTEHVQNRAIPYMREHGLGTTVACPNCNTFVLPYVFSLPVKCGKCGEPVFYKGMKHPWINWERYPIWSVMIWRYTQRRCGHKCANCGAVCGEMKLSRQEAAELLDIPDVGYYQLEQTWIKDTPVMVGPDGQLIVDKERALQDPEGVDQL